MAAATLADPKGIVIRCPKRRSKAELSHHLGYGPGADKPEQLTNQRNGVTAKTVLSGTARCGSRRRAIATEVVERGEPPRVLGQQRLPDVTIANRLDVDRLGAVERALVDFRTEVHLTELVLLEQERTVSSIGT